jgi:hypothetical protein
MSVDFAAVHWARRMAEAIQPLLILKPEDIQRLVPLIQALAHLPAVELSPQQLTVILQGMFSKTLTRLEADKGGVLVEFTGGGYAYERFLVRTDGRVPNSRYEAKKA